MRDTTEFRNKKAKIGNEFGHQKVNVNHLSFQKKKGHAPRNKGEHHGQNSQNFRARPAQFQGSVAQGGSWDLYVLGVVYTTQVSIVMGR